MTIIQGFERLSFEKRKSKKESKVIDCILTYIDHSYWGDHTVKEIIKDYIHVKTKTKTIYNGVLY
jgi:hypothetical protein